MQKAITAVSIAIQFTSNTSLRNNPKTPKKVTKVSRLFKIQH